jgi:hypothetical protein
MSCLFTAKPLDVDSRISVLCLEHSGNEDRDIVDVTLVDAMLALTPS